MDDSLDSRKLVLKEFKGISKLVKNVSMVGDFIVIQFKQIPTYRTGDLKQHFCVVLDEQLKSDIVFVKEAEKSWLFGHSKK